MSKLSELAKERDIKLRKLYDLLKPIFKPKIPIIIIYGGLETGKTDFALLLAEILIRFERREVATNIRCYDSDIEFIRDVKTLKQWLGIEPEDFERKKIAKVFILDEAATIASSRKALSKLNQELVKIANFLRKARCTLIFVTAMPEILDRALLSKDLIAAVIRKVDKKTAIVRSELLGEDVEIANIPRTSIQFDSYDIAIFSFEDQKEEEIRLEGSLKVLELFLKCNCNYAKLGRELGGLSRAQAKNEVKRALKLLLQDYVKLRKKH